MNVYVDFAAIVVVVVGAVLLYRKYGSAAKQKAKALEGDIATARAQVEAEIAAKRAQADADIAAAKAAIKKI